MPVIIDNFEVVAEPPPAAQTGTGAARPEGGQAASPPPATTAPAPLDLLRIEEHRFRRNLRLSAH
jgi:hypothetical protein